MTKYFIQDFRVDHRNILTALDGLEKDIETGSNNKEILEIIKKFFDNYHGYVQNHIAREEKLYNYLRKQFQERLKLDILTTSKTVITEEVKKLKNINLEDNAQNVLQITQDFIEKIKERIYLEEDSIFSAAEWYCRDGTFED